MISKKEEIRYIGYNVFTVKKNTGRNTVNYDPQLRKTMALFKSTFIKFMYPKTHDEIQKSHN